MTLTRSQTGKTPKKVQPDGFVETPSRRITRSRASKSPEYNEAELSSSQMIDSGKPRKRREVEKPVEDVQAETRSNGAACPAATTEAKAEQVVEHTDHFEFGGSWGVLSMMIGFPLLMYYMWIGAVYYDGHLPLPAEGQSTSDFVRHLAHLVYEGAFPSVKAWAIYWIFFIFEALCYMFLPGIVVKGRPLDHLGGKQLLYRCSAVSSFYTTIILAVGLHVSGLFKLYTIIDEFGPLMSVAILTGFIISFIAYFSAMARGAQHRITGYPIYDFFMGAELNPRMFGILDFKMFFEVRLPWYILLLVTMGAAARQYENYGYVSGEVGFLLMAHFLYANACSKGEECIIATWDIYYEKWGFMLIFWNLAGVPLSYCHCTVYLASHAPETYRWNKYALAAMYVSYLFVYWIWDTTNSQKNRFRQQQRGDMVLRKTFPQLPWQTVENPRTITSKKGDTILVDGWYGYARKIHYTCDLYFALMWGLVTGFESPFPWFYPVFFAAMIAHRAMRDIQRCRAKYGEAWTQYEKEVPYLFIPYVI
ncbi:Delta(24(24(1)))-sterol reductase [Coccidioides immitis RS]|uniref:Delta(24(24(1)))-sterol reductase n=2 Tax=Coccidioides immitis TaxID=5501 RepID=A0A0J8RPM2_COCIT|nr:Delta(24(24(1)))-sterol reductase [Coccidioides immitis RS]EAS37114.3 Delta(24(24(1)))-sterol reductase [Coccidioides immitis RS]KMP10055.1 Delta(24(24(1)))-sterol reductase [Coccidioides immitis RMSCC 2394]KMU86566.1 Delta(24(24(1)))-sterol reductase [Coccidioides immitis H538.4]